MISVASAALTITLPLASLHHRAPLVAELDDSRCWQAEAGRQCAWQRVEPEWINPGIGVEYQVAGRWSAMAGGFRNSYGRLSGYAGASYEVRPWPWLGVGAVGGVVTGYGDHPRHSSVQPVLLPMLSIGPRRMNLQLLHVPRRSTGFAVRYSW